MKYPGYKATITTEGIREAFARNERLIELPAKADPDCNVCKGKATVRSYGTAYRFGACPKCYPDHQFKARTFKQYMKGGVK